MALNLDFFARAPNQFAYLLGDRPIWHQPIGKRVKIHGCPPPIEGEGQIPDWLDLKSRVAGFGSTPASTPRIGVGWLDARQPSHVCHGLRARAGRLWRHCGARAAL